MLTIAKLFPTKKLFFFLIFFVFFQIKNYLYIKGVDNSNVKIIQVKKVKVMGVNYYVGILFGVFLFWVLMQTPTDIKMIFSYLREKVKNLVEKVKKLFKKC